MRKKRGKVMKNRKEKVKPIKRKSIWKDRASWELLLLCLPALIAYILFQYVPMAAAITIPFKNYKFSEGILGSDWAGLSNFKWIVSSTSMGRVLRNTVAYGAWFMIIGPVTNVIIALLLFEIRSRKALKAYQTIITFPNMTGVNGYYVGYANTVIQPSYSPAIVKMLITPNAEAPTSIFQECTASKEEIAFYKQKNYFVPNIKWWY